MPPAIEAALDAMKKAHGSPQPLDVAKAFIQSTGLVQYDLEAPAKKLYPVLTPLRNIIPRAKGQGDTATRWKAITAINTSNAHPGVSESNRGAVIAETVTDYTAAYAGLGLENSVSFEAEYAAEGFDDAKARAVESLLRSVMIQEEKMILGGNNLNALGTTPTPSAAATDTGGGIANGTYYVGCVALTHEGYWRSSVSATGVPATFTKTNADATTDTVNSGAAQASSLSTGVTISGSNVGTISASVTPVAGAVAYAWYVGVTGTGNQKIAAITTINSMKITALPDSGNQGFNSAPSADRSKQSLSFTGLFQFAVNAGVVSTLATGTAGTGTVLASDGKGGCSQIDALLVSMWNSYRLQPNRAWLHPTDLRNLSSKIIGGTSGTTPIFRFVTQNGAEQGALYGGSMIKRYMSPIDASVIEFNVHPNAVQGSILFTTDTLPYPTTNVAETFRMKCRREYYQLEWPLKTRKYEYGVYVDEVLQHYAPFSLGLLNNIADG